MYLMMKLSVLYIKMPEFENIMTRGDEFLFSLIMTHACILPHQSSSWLTVFSLTWILHSASTSCSLV